MLIDIDKKLWMWIILITVLAAAANANNEPATQSDDYQYNYSIIYPGGNITTEDYNIYSLIGEWYGGNFTDTIYDTSLTFWSTLPKLPQNEIVIINIAAPIINSITINPISGTITNPFIIRANITGTNINIIKIEISGKNYTLTNVGGDIYEYEYTDTGIEGVYIIDKLYASNTAGNSTISSTVLYYNALPISLSHSPSQTSTRNSTIISPAINSTVMNLNETVNSNLMRDYQKIYTILRPYTLKISVIIIMAIILLMAYAEIKKTETIIKSDKE